MTKKIELEDENLKAGIFGLVVALVEIIRDTVKLQAIKRMEKGNLNDEETERLGKALMKLDEAIEEIEEDYRVKKVTKEIRDQLDNGIEDILESFLISNGIHEKIVQEKRGIVNE